MENVQKNALKKLLQCHKWDILLGAGLLIIALCLLFVFRKTKDTGEYVRVERDGKIVAEYPLSEDGEYTYTSFFGNNTIQRFAFVVCALCTNFTKLILHFWNVNRQFTFCSHFVHFLLLY